MHTYGPVHTFTRRIISAATIALFTFSLATAQAPQQAAAPVPQWNLAGDPARYSADVKL